VNSGISIGTLLLTYELFGARSQKKTLNLAAATRSRFRLSPRLANIRSSIHIIVQAQLADSPNRGPA
jgi:hypothetical protein